MHLNLRHPVSAWTRKKCRSYPLVTNPEKITFAERFLGRSARKPAAPRKRVPRQLDTRFSGFSRFSQVFGVLDAPTDNLTVHIDLTQEPQSKSEMHYFLTYLNCIVSTTGIKK